MNDNGHRFGHRFGQGLALSSLPAAWMHSHRRKLLAAAAAGLSSAMVLLAGCGPVKLVASTNIPPPLVLKVPIGVALFVPTEFSNYVHKEERWSTKWHIELGKAQTDSITGLMNAMFERVVPVDSVNAGTQVPGGVAAILEPSIEEYAFVTPRDAGSPFYAVSIKYRVNVYLPDGKLADSWGFTGYGTAPSQGLSSEGPLHAATASAMRDAGAKLAVEFREQAVVRGLVPGAPTADSSPSAATPGAPGGNTPPATPGGDTTPGTEQSGSAMPGTEQPDAAASGTDEPGSATPGPEKPVGTAPNAGKSGTEKQDSAAPKAATPSTEAPGTAAPPNPPVAPPEADRGAVKENAGTSEPPAEQEEKPAEGAATQTEQTPEQASEEGDQEIEQGTDKKIPRQPSAPEAFALTPGGLKLRVC